jgi:hypothetical protein
MWSVGRVHQWGMTNAECRMTKEDEARRTRLSAHAAGQRQPARRPGGTPENSRGQASLRAPPPVRRAVGMRPSGAREMGSRGSVGTTSRAPPGRTIPARLTGGCARRLAGPRLLSRAPSGQGRSAALGLGAVVRGPLPSGFVIRVSFVIRHSSLQLPEASADPYAKQRAVPEGRRRIAGGKRACERRPRFAAPWGCAPAGRGKWAHADRSAPPPAPLRGARSPPV